VIINEFALGNQPPWFIYPGRLVAEFTSFKKQYYTSKRYRGNFL